MRKSIYIEGFGHGPNPVPAGCILHGQLVTGALFGTDPSTGKLAESAEDQCRLMFDVAERVLQAAGCGWEAVAKMVFYVRPELPREMINAHWVRLFPDRDSRPARHVVVNPELPPRMHLQCDLLALLEQNLNTPPSLREAGIAPCSA